MKRKIFKIMASIFVITLIAINTFIQINNNKSKDVKLSYLEAYASSHDEAQNVWCTYIPIPVEGCRDDRQDNCDNDNYCK